MSDMSVYCPLIEDKGIDGLSFGAHAEIDDTDSDGDAYCFGFRDTEFGDNIVCVSTSEDPFYYWAL